MLATESPRYVFHWQASANKTKQKMSEQKNVLFNAFAFFGSLCMIAISPSPAFWFPQLRVDESADIWLPCFSSHKIASSKYSEHFGFHYAMFTYAALTITPGLLLLSMIALLGNNSFLERPVLNATITLGAVLASLQLIGLLYQFSLFVLLDYDCAEMVFLLDVRNLALGIIGTGHLVILGCGAICLCLFGDQLHTEITKTE